MGVAVGKNLLVVALVEAGFTVGLDRDRRVLSALPPYSAITLNSALNPVAPVSIRALRHNRAALVDERHIIMRLGPIDPARELHLHKSPFRVVFSFVLELEAGAAT